MYEAYSSYSNPPQDIPKQLLGSWVQPLGLGCLPAVPEVRVLQEHKRKQKEMEQLEKQIKDFRESRRQGGGIGDSS